MAFFLPYHPVALTSHPIFTGACSNTGLPMTTPTPTLTRPQLMARLAGERGHLLWAITALSETTLSEGLLHGDWHVKDLFPHIGRWDEVYTNWLSLMLENRGGEIPIMDYDATNRIWHKQTQDYTLEQGIAIMLKARAGLWAALERLTDEKLERPVTLATGQVTRAQWAIVDAYQHDAEHAAEILAWRQANEIPRAPGPLCLVRALVRATRKEFQAVAANVPDVEKSSRPVCGDWTLQDVYGHITDWEQFGVEGIEKVLTGETTITSPFGPDIQAWNDAHAAARQGQSWEQVWCDYQTTRQNFFYALDKLTQDDLSRPVTTPWGQSSLYRWINIWTHHEREHAADLRRELALPDTPDYLLP